MRGRAVCGSVSEVPPWPVGASACAAAGSVALRNDKTAKPAIAAYDLADMAPLPLFAQASAAGRAGSTGTASGKRSTTPLMPEIVSDPLAWGRIKASSLAEMEV